MELWEAQELADQLERELSHRHGINDRDDWPAEDDEEPFVETIETIRVVRCDGCGYLDSVCDCTPQQVRAKLVRELG